MSIYKPTWLYIKQHNQTGLKYFGKTVKADPIKYKGSGKVWAEHLKLHGNDVTTMWYCLFTEKELLFEFASAFSTNNNIVESIEWANLIPESGRGWIGNKASDETRAKLSAARKGKHFRPLSEAQKIKLSIAMKGKKRNPRSDETKAKLSSANKGKVFSAETRQKLSVAAKNRWQNKNSG